MIVVGAGVVGLAVAYQLVSEGAEVTVVDRDPEGDKASFGNAGGFAVTEVYPASVPGLAWRVPRWMLDPLGPLAVRPMHAPRLVPWLVRFARAGTPAEVDRISTALAALNSRTYDDLLPMLERTGLSSELHRRGALTVYRSEEALRRDDVEWDIKRRHGVEFEVISGREAIAMEPALAPTIKRAVFAPRWSHLDDPKRLVDALRAWLSGQGVKVVRKGVANVLPPSGSRAAVALEDGGRMDADRVVVAAGAWSGRIAKRFGDPVSIESERGYNTTIPEPGVHLTREIIFAERKFVATPLSCGLRIGGAAEFGGLDAKANYKRSHALVALASEFLPGLKAEGGTAWAGHRPTTPDSLPVIGPSTVDDKVLYAFGHGHLGLTQAATTGRLVADLVAGRRPPIDASAYSIARFR